MRAIEWFAGVLTLIMQGAGVSLICSRISDLTIVKLSAVTLALSYLALVNLNKEYNYKSVLQTIRVNI